MRNSRTGFLPFAMACLLGGAVAMSSAGTAHAQASQTEQALWKLEHSYWRYVQDNDLPAYLGLWNSDLLAWPSANAAPVHKDHITDWITMQTSKGLTLRATDFKTGEIQVIGNVAVAAYWVTYKWVDKDGAGAAHTVRVTHTWIGDGKAWHLVGGMSMPEPQK
jgi:ketosteroid isomerase-like protein